MKWNFKPSQTPKPVENQRVFLCKIICAYPRGRFLFKPENISNFRQKKPGHGVGLLRAAVLLKNRAFSFRYLFIPVVHRSILPAKYKPCFFKRTKPCASLMQDTPYFQGKNSGKAALSKIRPRPSGDVSGCAGSLPLSLIHISEPTRHLRCSYSVFCLKKIFFLKFL